MSPYCYCGKTICNCNDKKKKKKLPPSYNMSAEDEAPEYG